MISFDIHTIVIKGFDSPSGDRGCRIKKGDSSLAARNAQDVFGNA